MTNVNGSKAVPHLLNFLNAEEVGRRLGRKKAWVQEYTRRGIIPVIKVGQQRFYTEEAVDTALRRREQ